MTAESLKKIGKRTAVISFLVGTCIFALYFFTSWDEVLIAGYAFILLTGLINIGVFVSILIKAGSDKKNRKGLFLTSGFMLLNIPVMFIYCWVAVILLNTMKITFTNSTQSNLTNINIAGCGNSQITELKVGESKTVWFKINGDGSIIIDYLYNGQQTKAVVAGYVTNNMGQKMKYNIGEKNSLQF